MDFPQNTLELQRDVSHLTQQKRPNLTNWRDRGRWGNPEFRAVVSVVPAQVERGVMFRMVVGSLLLLLWILILLLMIRVGRHFFVSRMTCSRSSVRVAGGLIAKVLSWLMQSDSRQVRGIEKGKELELDLP